MTDFTTPEMKRLMQLSQEVKRESGEPEQRLRGKCRWERMSRTAVIREWGDPRTWQALGATQPAGDGQ